MCFSERGKPGEVRLPHLSHRPRRYARAEYGRQLLGGRGQPNHHHSYRWNTASPVEGGRETVSDGWFGGAVKLEM